MTEFERILTAFRNASIAYGASEEGSNNEKRASERIDRFEAELIQMWKNALNALVEFQKAR